MRYLYFVLIWAVNICHAQDWQQVANYPITTVDATSFVIDGVGYVGTADDNFNDIFYRYNEGDDSWSLISQPMAPELSGRQGGTAFAVDGKGYVLGGQRADEVPNPQDVWAYDPETDTWEQKSNFPGDQFFLADLVSFVIEDKAYVKVGGLNDFYEYDPETDTWSQKAQFPGVATGEHVAFAINGKGYIGLGNGLDGFSDIFYSYDPDSDSWTSISSFGGGARIASVAFVLEDKAYVGFGFNQEGTYFDDLYVYDDETDTWDFVNNSGYFVQDAVAFSTGSYAYVGTGNQFLDIFNQFWRFSPTTTSTTEKNIDGTFKLYPNPTQDWLQIELVNGNYTIKQIEIYNSLGQKIKTTSGTLEVPIHDLSAGPYWLTIYTSSGNITKKFIKN